MTCRDNPIALKHLHVPSYHAVLFNIYCVLHYYRWNGSNSFHVETWTDREGGVNINLTEKNTNSRGMKFVMNNIPDKNYLTLEVMP